jgi:hypothetical protein
MEEKSVPRPGYKYKYIYIIYTNIRKISKIINRRSVSKKYTPEPKRWRCKNEDFITGFWGLWKKQKKGNKKRRGLI